MKGAQIVILSGKIADAGQFDDWGEALVLIASGPHRGHIAEYSTAKYNCGAYLEELHCQCAKHWQNQSYGCPSHQRPQSGDQTLRPAGPARDLRGTALAVALTARAVVRKKAGVSWLRTAVRSWENTGGQI